MILIVGQTGRMSLELQKVLSEKKQKFSLWIRGQEPDLKKIRGIIDFSSPEASLNCLQKAASFKIPYVCGTTGWADLKKSHSIFLKASKRSAIVLDSNFSRGIEILCQMAELLAKRLHSDSGSHSLSVLDLHHRHKKDSPSGTGLKIMNRIAKEFPIKNIKIDSIRLGDIPGEHRVLASFENQTLEIIHRAHSRRPFAEGAVSALEWAQKQKPGLYTMEDMLS